MKQKMRGIKEYQKISHSCGISFENLVHSGAKPMFPAVPRCSPLFPAVPELVDPLLVAQIATTGPGLELVHYG
jgi:hypothetical protein